MSSKPRFSPRVKPVLAALAVLAIFTSLSVSQTQPASTAATAPPPPAATAPAPPATPAKATPAKADDSLGISQVQDLLSSLNKFDQAGRPSDQKIGFELPEVFVNQYLAYILRTKPRPGLNSVKLSLSPNNQITAETEIDFDEVQKWNAAIIPDILRPVFAGKRTIKTDLQFDAKDGFSTFSLKNAQGPDGKAMVNKLMMGVLQTLGSRQPEGFNTDKPTPLPFGLKRVWTEKQLLCGET